MGKQSSKALESALPLKTRMESMSDRTRALLEYYFENECRACFKYVSDNEDPDVIIVDYDHPGSLASVAAGQWKTERPLLLLSFSETSVPGAIVVGKPFDKHKLRLAAQRLVASEGPEDATESLSDNSATEKAVEPAEKDAGNLDTSDGVSKPVTDMGAVQSAQDDDNSRQATAEESIAPDSVSLAPAKKSEGNEKASLDLKQGAPSTDKASLDPELAARQARLETKVVLLCGPARSIADLESANDKTHRFSMAIHLSGHIEKAQQRCGRDGIIAVQLTLPTMEIYVLHWLQKILTTASLKSAKNINRAFCALDDDQIKMTVYRSDTVNELVKRVNGTGKFSFSTEAFVWLSALFSARGRLPDDVDLDEQWRMIHWPNLTRLEPVPQCVETASAWSREPSSIRQIITRTGHQPRHVTAFFNGARALQLMEPMLSESETASKAPTTETDTDRTMADREPPEQG